MKPFTHLSLAMFVVIFGDEIHTIPDRVGPDPETLVPDSVQLLLLLENIRFDCLSFAIHHSTIFHNHGFQDFLYSGHSRLCGRGNFGGVSFHFWCRFPVTGWIGRGIGTYGPRKI
jgi:hypothetical protein